MNKLGFNVRAMAGTIVFEIIGEMYYWDELDHYLRWKIAEHGTDAPMIVRIDSIGGDPRAGLALYNVIKNHKGSTTGYIEYVCDSSATLPACGCDVVVGNDFPFEYMVHEPKIDQGWATVEEGQAGVDYLDGIRDDFVRIYMEKTGQNEADIRAWMKQTKFMKAEEALALGFIDRIEAVQATLAAQVDYQLAAKAYDRPKGYELEGRGTSPATPTKTNTKMSTENKNWLQAKLAAMFGKGDNAEEQDLFLDAKELKATADKVPDLEQSIIDKDAEIARLTAENDALKGGEPTEEELAQQTATAIDADLEAAVKSFKITAAAKPQYATAYEGKPAELKAALDLIAEGTVKPGREVHARTTAKAGSGIHPNVAAAFGK